MSNFEWNAFKQQVLDYLTSQEVELTNNQPWIIGVSGGADSIALMHVLVELKKNLIVAHVNYHKRGSESDKDEKFVKKWAEKYNLPFYVKDGTITESGNFQELARLLRYRFFEDLKDHYDATHIVTAHHLDDYSENVLFRTLRGSSSEAILSRNLSQPNLLRPFLKISSSDIRKNMMNAGFDWREDQSNAESSFTRNWLRNNVIPELDKRIPGWNQHLVENATLEDELIEELSRVHEKEIFVESNRISIDLILFEKISFRILKAILFKKLVQLNWQVSSSALDEISHLVSSQKGKNIQLAEKVFALRSTDKIIIVEKEIDFEQFALIDSLNKKEPIQVLGFQMEKIERAEIKNLSRKDYLFLDMSKVVYPVIIRSWQQGDRIQPLGMSAGSKLISDIITDSKIDLYQKNKVLVIQDDSKTCLAVCFPEGFEAFNRIADFAKVNESTKEVVQIKSNSLGN